jgi:hypothetical protein
MVVRGDESRREASVTCSQPNLICTPFPKDLTRLHTSAETPWQPSIVLYIVLHVSPSLHGEDNEDSFCQDKTDRGSTLPFWPHLSRAYPRALLLRGVEVYASRTQRAGNFVSSRTTPH